MDIRELRVGNWVDVKYVNGSSNLTRTQFNYDLLKYLHLAEPIPLTPELLERCGFEKHKNSNEFWSFYVTKNGIRLSMSHHTEKSAGVVSGCFYWSDDYIEVNFLHTLQNIIHSLTGTELEVKW